MLQDTPGRARPTIHALYLHIPFCFHKCHYCDFYSIVDDSASGDRQEVFTDRLIAELRHRAGQVELQPVTIFVGGGTPTLLRTALWSRLLETLWGVVDRRTVVEFTVEANPETVTPELMDVLVQGGVNRVSLGAQSFQPALLKTLERWHEPASVGRAVGVVRGAGIANINLDLIFAIPGETTALLNTDLDALLAMSPDHVSCYGLTYEPNTAMTQRLKMRQFEPIAEEVERDMYAVVMDRLAAAGFEQYEVSNFARKNRRCQHNLAYWTNRNWIGVGPGAASHIDGHRWKNQPHLGRYLAMAPEPPIVDEEHLPEARRTGEELMLRLRLRDGVERAWLTARLPESDPRAARLRELTEMGMLEWSGDRLRLTRAGIFVADSVIAELL
ncbi:MAG: radical SAM family heme chaperone HemW [Planctomycetes bacterium]|nr:radical SAM family heme chaperone HemW [Planctomycetota bacterium]